MTETIKQHLKSLAPETKAHHLVGQISKPHHRSKAIDTMRKGGMVQFIIGNENCGVGGIFFDIDNPKAVENVIRAKSTPQKTRQSMFAVMTPEEYFHEISGLDYRIDFTKLTSHPCFIRIPVKNHKLFPDHAKSLNSAGQYIVQAFPSDLVPHFKELVREAALAKIRIAGTSLNYTGQGNLTDLQTVARFFIDSPGHKYWLDTSAKFTGVSWTIIELRPGTREAILHREGNSPITSIIEALFGSNS